MAYDSKEPIPRSGEAGLHRKKLATEATWSTGWLSATRRSMALM
jgi:hypothetical protein